MSNMILHIIFKDRSEMVLNEQNANLNVVTKEGEILSTNIENNLYSYFSLAQDNVELFQVLSHGKKIIEQYSKFPSKSDGKRVKTSGKPSVNYSSTINYLTWRDDPADTSIKVKSK